MWADGPLITVDKEDAQSSLVDSFLTFCRALLAVGLLMAWHNERERKIVM